MTAPLPVLPITVEMTVQQAIENVTLNLKKAEVHRFFFKSSQMIIR